MKNIALKLNEQILSETERLLEHLDTSRNKYINDAVNFYNQFQKRKLIEAQLAKESSLIQADSLDVLHEFEQLDDEI